MKHAISLFALIAAMPALAEDTRQLDAHEHGVGALNIAVEGTTVAMEFTAPGADIVGFEYAAKTDADRAAIDAAVAALAAPLDLFIVPSAAACSVTQASAGLKSEQDHEDHDAHEGHEPAEHAEGETHAAHEHAEQNDHEEHAGGASHTEFHAEYLLTCANPDALTRMEFAYFDRFDNARELEVQIITASGAQAFEVERDAPELDLRNLF